MKQSIQELETRLANVSTPHDKIIALNDLAWKLTATATDLERANILAEDARMLALETEPGPQAVSLSILSRISAMKSKYGHALLQGHQALDDFDESPDPIHLPAVLYTLAASYRELGDFSTALEMALRQLRYCEEHNDLEGQARARNMLGTIYSRLNRYEESGTHYERSLTLWHELGDSPGQASAHHNLQLAYFHRGEFEKARLHGHEARRLFADDENAQGGTYAELGLARLYAQMGNLEEAFEHANQARDLAEGTPLEYRCEVLQVLGELFTQAGQHEDAILHLQRALALANESDSLLMQEECHERLVTVHKLNGDFERAFFHLEQVNELRTKVLNEQSEARFASLEVRYRTNQLKQEAERERKLREQDRQHYEQLVKIKNELLSTVSHDLKNPLSLIQIATTLLESALSPNDQAGHQQIDRIRRSAKQITELVVNVLDFAVIDSQRTLSLRDHPLAQFLESAVDSFVPLAQEKNISIRLEPVCEDLIISMDVLKVKRALNNLIANAIRYTPENGHVQVAAESTATHISIHVRDTGIGIPEDDIPHIFAPFHRTADARSMSDEGTGLGLAIVKSIVEQHGGEVVVQSTLGEGSTFGFKLPISPPNA